jgi:hypothetical protein
MALQPPGDFPLPLRRLSLKWRCRLALFPFRGDQKALSLCVDLYRRPYSGE